MGMLGLLAPLVAGAGLVGWSGWVSRKAEQAVPADGNFVDVPGARLHYVEKGQGPAIVMIHGLLAQLRNFSYAMLDDLARDHRVILVDRPGWGWSTLTGPRPGIAAQGDMIAALLDKLEVERPVLVGHSMGGAVSLGLALNHVARVRGLALIAPLTQPVATVPAPFRGLVTPAPLRPFLAWTVAVPAAMLNGAKATREVFAPDPVPGDFATRGGGLLAIRPQSYQAGAFELSIAERDMAAIAARYGALDLPVSILFGREDNLLDPELHGRHTADAIRGAHLTLAEGGHMLPITAPADTLAWLRAAIAAM